MDVKLFVDERIFPANKITKDFKFPARNCHSSAYLNVCQIYRCNHTFILFSLNQGTGNYERSFTVNREIHYGTRILLNTSEFLF